MTPNEIMPRVVLIDSVEHHVTWKLEDLGMGMLAFIADINDSWLAGCWLACAVPDEGRPPALGEACVVELVASDNDTRLASAPFTAHPQAALRLWTTTLP